MAVHADAGTGAVIDAEEAKSGKDKKREHKQERKREHQP